MKRFSETWGSRAVVKRVFNGFSPLSFLACFYALGAVFFWTSPLSALTQKQQTVLKNAVVSIHVHVTRSAYGSLGKHSGTGFVCHKGRGIILTNQHVVGYGSVATYTITFANGQKLPARLLYIDPWHDFAFLEIEKPSRIPSDVRALNVFKRPRMGESVYIVGNNEGQGFSFQKGFVTSLFQDAGFLPEPSFSAIMNSRGGSSGSPLVNDSLHVLGLNYAGNNRGTALVLHACTFAKALTSILKNAPPSRKHVGAVCRLVSLDECMRFRKFPEAVARGYMKAHPQSNARVLMVVGSLKGSPAEGCFNIGDVIWKVDDKDVAADLSRFEKVMDETARPFVMIDFYRQGQRMRKKVSLYNLHDLTVKKLLVFGGATFFEANDFMRWQFGVAPGALLVGHMASGSSFDVGLTPSFSAYRDTPKYLGVRHCQMEGLTFQALVDRIPALVKQKHFILNVRWFPPLPAGYSGLFFHNNAEDQCGITYHISQNTLPELIEYSFKERAWKVSSILCHGEPRV